MIGILDRNTSGGDLRFCGGEKVVQEESWHPNSVVLPKKTPWVFMSNKKRLVVSGELQNLIQKPEMYASYAEWLVGSSGAAICLMSVWNSWWWQHLPPFFAK